MVIDLTLAIAIVGCLLGVLAWFDGRRKVAVAEGKHLQEISEMQKKIAALEGEVRAVQECYANTDGDIREIKNDISWIKQALSEIKTAMENKT